MDLSKLTAEQLKLALDLSKKYDLNEDQLPIALKVRDEAIRQKVNPDFILPMVKVESNFNPEALSDKGAFGVMQLMPDTATSLKVNAKNLDENIRGGISLIKELQANEKIGNDPYKVLAGYNASTATRNKYYESGGDLSVLPTETLKHMERVTSAYGQDLPSVSYEEPSAEAPKPAPATTEQPKGTPLGGDASEPPEIPRALAGLAGASAGTSLGSTAALTAAKVRGTTDLLKMASQIPGVLDAVKSGIPVKDALAAAMQPKNVIPETGMPPAQGEFPAKTTGTYNYGKKFGLTNTEAAGAVDMSKQPNGVWDLKRKADLAMQKIGPGYVSVPERADLLLPEQVGSGPRGVPKAPIPTVAPPPAESPLASALGRYMGYAKLPVIGGLSGLALGQGAADFANRANQKRYGEAALSGAGTAAGAVAPFLGATAGLATAPLSMGIPLYLSASDRIRYLKKHPEEVKLEETSVDPMGNKIY
jgi:hypothetical protein